MNNKSKKTKWIYFISIVLLFAGCALGPPPPIFPGFEWLIIAIVIWIGIFLWNKYSYEKPEEPSYLTETLNAINQRLKELEEKINELRKKQNQEKDI